MIPVSKYLLTRTWLPMKFSPSALIFLLLIISACNQQISTEEYLQRGQDYLTQNEFNRAVIELKNAVKQSPDSAKARNLLGQVYVKIHNGDAAIKELTRAIELGQDRYSVLFNLGIAYEQLGLDEKILDEITINEQLSVDTQAEIHALRAKALIRRTNYDQAKQELEKAKKLNNQLTNVRLSMALYEKYAGNVAQQRQWLEPLLQRGGGIADAWSQIAEIEQNSNQPGAAEKAYTRAIESRQVIHIDLLKRALLRISQQNYDGAVEDINTAKKAGAKWPVIGYAEGLIAYQKKQFDKAQGILEQIISKHPDYAPSRLLMGMTLYNKLNYQYAATQLEYYLKNYPDDNQANLIYANSLIKLGKHQYGIDILERLNKKLPDDFRILSILGGSYISANQLERGIQLLRKATSVNPDHAVVRLQLGKALLSSGSQLEQGQQQIIKAINLDPELIQADLLLYSSHMRDKNFEAAREVANNLISKQEGKSVGYNLIALAYLAENKKKEAVDLLKSSLGKFPADPLTSNNLARIYVQQNQLEQAKKLYLDVLSKEPSHLTTLNQMAVISARENNGDELISWLNKAAELNPQALSAKLLLATQYLRQNKAKLALQTLQNVDQSKRDNTGFILLQAKGKMGIKEYGHAVRALKGLVSKQPKLASAHFLLAQAYGFQNNPEKMREFLDNTIELSPDLLNAHLILARLDMLEGKKAAFNKRVARLMKRYPDSKDVQLLNAKVISNDKDYGKAIKTLSLLLEVAPNPEVIIDLARNQWKSGDRNNAISGLEIWIEDHQDDLRTLLVLAQYYQAENRMEDARRTYLKLDKVMPNNTIALNNLAWLMKDTNPKRALNYAEKAIKNDPENPYIQDTLAMLWLENGDPQKALVYSEKAATAAPEFEDIQYNYARILIANNRNSEAKKILSKLLKTTRSDDKREMIRNNIEKL